MMVEAGKTKFEDVVLDGIAWALLQPAPRALSNCKQELVKKIGVAELGIRAGSAK